MTASLEAIEAFLTRHLGIKPDAIGRHVVERGVQTRMTVLGLASTVDYLARLESAQEVYELVETLVNRETWFFREARPFSDIIRQVRDRPRPSRLLSLPCSTGEEPYTLAMALLDGGVSPAGFHIDALDISHTALAVASRGLYGKGSFRGSDLGYRERWFRSVGGKWEVSSPVRKAVNFMQGNVLQGLGTAQRYDVIVCRNLLIYLTPPACARLFEVLHLALEAEGRLVLSASEANLAPREQFSAVSSAIFCRATEAPSRPRPAARVQAAPRKPARAQAVPPPPPPSAEVELASILDLANQGRYDQAAERCQAVVSRFGPSAQAFYLMGLVDGARGRDEAAVDSLRRALYLDPKHEEAQLLLVIHRRRAGRR